jgi:hypothetical protein
MSLCTIAELRTVLGIGTLVSDATLQEVCDAADNVLLPFVWNNSTFNVAHSNTTNTGTLYFENSIEHIFYVGQTVVIANTSDIGTFPDNVNINGSYTIQSIDYLFNFFVLKDIFFCVVDAFLPLEQRHPPQYIVAH